MLKYKILFICLSIGLVAFAQNGTSSPYSRFGYGILGDNAIGAQRAMGGVGYALHNNRQINVMNPASYASMDSLTFLFDIGLTYQNTITKEGSLKENSQSGSLDYIVMQFPLGRYMAGSVGLLPYSNVGYSFINSIDNGSDSRSGDGNISQAYVGVSGRPFKGFSIGANISYLFGNLTNTNTVVPESGSSGIFETMLKVRDYHLSFGAQYAIEWNKKHTITLGAVYSPGKALLGKAYTSTYDVSSNTTIDADTLKMKNNYSLASTYGGGISYNYDKRLTVAADDSTPFAAGVCGLFLSALAFMIEYFRAGIESVSRGHVEAARSLGLGVIQTMRFVILPLAIRVVLPPLTGHLVGLLKATAFVSVVGMPELLKRAMEIVEWKANPTPLVTITIMYLILLLPLMYGSTLLERRLARWTTPHRA